MRTVYQIAENLYKLDPNNFNKFSHVFSKIYEIVDGCSA